MKRKSFVLYTDMYEAINNLPDAECAELLRMIFQYVRGEKVKNKHVLSSVAFDFIKPHLDRDSEKYEKVLKAKSEGGKKAMSKRWDKTPKESITKGKTLKESIRVVTDNVNVNENVNENEKGGVGGRPATPNPPSQESNSDDTPDPDTPPESRGSPKGGGVSIKSQAYLKSVPDPDVEQFTKEFVCSARQVREKADDLLGWCKANGKKKKDYQAFLRNALKKDFGHRRTVSARPPDGGPKLTPEEQRENLEKINATKQKIREKLIFPVILPH